MLVCHAVDTASLATSILFGKLICVATLFAFGEKRCRKNLPLDDLDVLHVTIAMNDSRDLDSIFDLSEENYVVAYAKRPASWNAKTGPSLSHSRLRRDRFAYIANFLHPTACGSRFVACNKIDNTENVVVGLGCVDDYCHHTFPFSISSIRSSARRYTSVAGIP